MLRGALEGGRVVLGAFGWRGRVGARVLLQTREGTRLALVEQVSKQVSPGGQGRRFPARGRGSGRLPRRGQIASVSAPRRHRLKAQHRRPSWCRHPLLPRCRGWLVRQGPCGCPVPACVSQVCAHDLGESVAGGFGFLLGGVGLEVFPNVVDVELAGGCEFLLEGFEVLGDDLFAGGRLRVLLHAGNDLLQPG